MGALDVGGRQSRFQCYPQWPEVLALREMFRVEPLDPPSIAVLRRRHIGDLEQSDVTSIREIADDALDRNVVDML